MDKKSKEKILKKLSNKKLIDNNYAQYLSEPFKKILIRDINNIKDKINKLSKKKSALKNRNTNVD